MLLALFARSNPAPSLGCKRFVFLAQAKTWRHTKTTFPNWGLVLCLSKLEKLVPNKPLALNWCWNCLGGKGAQVPASWSGITALTLHTFKMRFSPREQRANWGETERGFQMKGQRERRKKSRAGNRGGLWTQIEYQWAAALYMQVKSLLAVGCYTTLAQAYLRARDLVDKWTTGREREACNSHLSLILKGIMKLIPLDGTYFARTPFSVLLPQPDTRNNTWQMKCWKGAQSVK